MSYVPVHEDSGAEYTFYVPHMEEPTLRKEEKDVLLHEEGYIKSLHRAFPAILSLSSEGRFVHQRMELDRHYYLIAELEQSNHLILFEKSMYPLSEDEYELATPKYFVDIYFQPFFGAVLPKELLLVPVQEMDYVPNSTILFSVS